MNNRAKSILLVETCQAFFLLPALSSSSSVDSIYIGLNDLSLDCGVENMIDLVSDGWMEIASTLIKGRKPFGFGGVSSLNDQTCMTPAQDILNVHKAIGSNSVILSRSFFKHCQVLSKTTGRDLQTIIRSEISDIKDFLKA